MASFLPRSKPIKVVSEHTDTHVCDFEPHNLKIKHKGTEVNAKTYQTWL